MQHCAEADNFCYQLSNIDPLKSNMHVGVEIHMEISTVAYSLRALAMALNQSTNPILNLQGNPSSYNNKSGQ